MPLCSPWADAGDLPETCDQTAVKPATLERAFQYSSEILYHLTRRKYSGECTDEVTPLGANCWSCHRSHASSWPHGMLELPSRPVISIESVILDGVTLAPSEYVLHDRRYLRRVDGSWPCAYDLDDADRFVVSYTWGRVPGPSMVLAAALLGWEFAVSWTPDCSAQCRLPKRIQTVTRQGISFAILDPLTLFADGLTGLPDVDMLVQAELRGDRQRRATVTIPGAGPSATRR